MKESPDSKKEFADDEIVSLSADESAPVASVEEAEVETQVLEVAETVKAEETKPVVKAAGASSGAALSASSKLGVLLAVILLSGVGLLFWKIKVGGQSSPGLTKLTKANMETIFKDVPPEALKQLAENPEAKKKEIEGIKQFLALAEEARASGYANKPEIKKELEELKMGILAQSYDKEKNKDKENLPPFSAITKEEVDGYFLKGTNQQKFDEMLKQEIADAKKDGKVPPDFEVSAEQLVQVKERYAKVRIYADEAKEKWSSLSEEFKTETEFQIKFQEAQYLVSRYAQEELAKKIEANEEDLKKYLAEHPDEAKIFDEKRTKAEEILQRVKNGEDFAKLAAEFSDDPSGKADGGLIKDITKGSMVKEFEKTSLALEAGQVSPTLAWTKYGYHIIKLERKGMSKDPTGKDAETYDTRHILISVKAAGGETPPSPMAQPSFLRDKIEKEVAKNKQKKILDEIVARHPIEIEDFDIKVPPMPEGQKMPAGMPQGMPQGQNGQQPQPDQKQMEELQKKLKEIQEQQKNAPKSGDKQPPKTSAPANKGGK